MSKEMDRIKQCGGASTVIKLQKEGYTTRQVAKFFGVSPTTVLHYMREKVKVL